MRKIILTLLLAVACILPAQAGEPEVITLNPIQVCTVFQGFGTIYAMNYLKGGHDKEAQLKNIRENIFPGRPALKAFEPGIIKTLDGLMRGRDYLDTIPPPGHEYIAQQFGKATAMSCYIDESMGWVNENKWIKFTLPPGWFSVKF